MATQRQNGDDQSKQPNGKKPKPEQESAVPDLSIEESVPQADEIPLVEAAPEETGDAFVLADEEPVEEAAGASEVAEAEPIEEAAPVSDIAEAEPVAEEDAEEVLSAEDAVEVTGSSVVLAEADAAPEVAAPMEAAASPPASDVDLLQLFEETPSATTPAESVPVETPAEAVAESPMEPVFSDSPTELAAPEAHDAVFDEAVAETAAPEEPVVEAATPAEPFAQAPAEEVVEAVVSEEPVVEAATPAEPFAQAPAEEVVEAVVSEEPVVEAATPAEPIAEAQAEEVVAAESLVAEPDVEELVAAELEEPIEAVAEEVVEAAPTSDTRSAEDVLFDEAIAEAVPASAAKSGEVVEELVEAVEEASSAARKAAAVMDDEEVAEAEEVVSGVEAAEEAEPVSAVAAEEVLEAEPASTGSSAVVLDELVDAGSGAKKKPSSGVAKTAEFGQTVAFESPSSAAKQKKPDSNVLVTEEDLGEAAPASAVDLGEMPARKGGSSVSGIDKLAEALESGVGLDEAGADESMKKTAGSVEFDELLDDIGDSGEGEIAPSKAKKPVGAGEDTELDDMDAEELVEAVEEAEEGVEAVEAVEEAEEDLEAVEAVEEGIEEVAEADEAIDAAEEDAEAVEEVAEAEEDETPVSKKKKSKAAVKAADDEVDLGELFGGKEEEAEAVEAEEAEAEAVEAEEGEEAEAVEAEAEEAIAEVDEDEDFAVAKKTKTGKKTRMPKDEDEEEVAEEDEEETTARKKKKKGKRDRDLAVPAAAGAGGGGFGCFSVIFLLFFVIILIGGGGAATWYFAPEQIDNLVKLHPDRAGKEPTKPGDGGQKAVELTKAQKARDQIAEGRFGDAVAELKDAAEPAELAVRGEARWLAYLKDQTDKKAPLDKDAPAVKDAVADLTKGKNDLLLGQIDTQLRVAALKGDAEEKINKLLAETIELAKQVKSTTDEKAKADKLLDGLADVLVKGKFIDDKGSFDVASLQKTIKSLSDDRTVLEMVNKMLKDAEVKGAGDEGLKELLKAKKAVVDAFDAVNKELESAKIKDPGAAGVKQLVAEKDGVIKDRAEILDTLKSAFQELIDGKIVTDAKADPRKSIVKGVQDARKKAESPLAIPLTQLGLSLDGIGKGTGKIVEQAFDRAKLASELSWFNTREKFIETPQQKMKTYIMLLQDRKQNDAKRLDDISREAAWVFDPESRSKEEERSQALYVQGLALRNVEKFAEARAKFSESIAMLNKIGKTGTWAKLVRQSHAEITEPSYYLGRIERFQNEENFKAALGEANIALKAMPDEARLFSARGLVRLDLIRGQGAKTADEDRKAIRDDAESAKKDAKLGSDAAYILGLLEEELTNWPEAEKNFRMALKLHDDRKGPADEAGKYRVALARLLLRDRPEVAPAPEEKKKEDGGEKKDEKDKKDAKEKKDDKGVSFPPMGSPQVSTANLRDLADQVTVIHPWSLLLTTAVIAQTPEELEDAATLARLKEVIDEANKLIANKNPKLKGEGYLARGKALSKLGKRTEGLKDYTEGMKLIYPGIKTEELDQLVKEHPAFQAPDTSSTPNPVIAERHFAEGLHFFWAKEFVKSEEQFFQAIKYYKPDARYHYFVGLAILAQKDKKKRDTGLFHFEQGAYFEARAASLNPLVLRDVNASLERIQGEQRQLLNTYRYKARAAAAAGELAEPK